MLDYQRIGKFILLKRKELQLTQQQLAEYLKISYQAVSRWENGTALPTLESLKDLSYLFNITIDELLDGQEKGTFKFNYVQSGIDLSMVDLLDDNFYQKNTHSNEMFKHLDLRADFYEFNSSHLQQPVLVSKTLEPGTKQKITIEYGYIKEIAYDFVNGLINDILSAGAEPLFIQDVLICGKFDKEIIMQLKSALKEVSLINDCDLLRGQISIQKHVLNVGDIMLTGNILGIAEKEQIIDGTNISVGDSILAVASNGLHNNGYSLIYTLLEKYPEIKSLTVDNERFLNLIMQSQNCYYQSITYANQQHHITGMANVAGGGIQRHIKRILPMHLTAEIDLSCIHILPIFKILRGYLKISDMEMLEAFNCGVGFIIVVPEQYKENIKQIMNESVSCYEIGIIKEGNGQVTLKNLLNWL